MKTPKIDRYYINWNEPMYDIRDRQDGDKVVDSYAVYGDAIWNCDQLNKGAK